MSKLQRIRLESLLAEAEQLLQTSRRLRKHDRMRSQILRRARLRLISARRIVRGDADSE